MSLLLNEAVAHPGFGDEVLRTRWIRFELVSDLAHIEAQVVRLLFVLRSPHLLQQLLLRYELSAVSGEHLDDLPLSGREVDVFVTSTDFLGAEIDGEVGGRHNR